MNEKSPERYKDLVFVENICNNNINVQLMLISQKMRV